jgi:hypothetical protein
MNDPKNRIQNGMERLALFLSIIGGSVAVFFFVIMGFDGINFDAWWAYIGALTYSFIGFAMIIFIIYSVFLGVNWIVNGFFGKVFSKSFRKKILKRFMYFVLIPLLLSLTSFSIKKIFEPKGPFILESTSKDIFDKLPEGFILDEK